MKKLLFIIGFSAIVGFVQAQTTATEQPKIGTTKKVKMAKELNLTKNQKKEMKAIKEDNKAKEESIKNNTGLSEGAKKQQLKQLKMDQKKSVAKLLTTEQKAKLADLQQKKKADTTNAKY